jgi:hypothetical protein
MSAVSRRTLFGLLAGAVVAPMVKADLMLGVTPIYYDRFSGLAYSGIETLLPRAVTYWEDINGKFRFWPEPEDPRAAELNQIREVS